MKKTFENAPLVFDHDYHIRVPEKPKRIYVLLHGYLLDGEFMFKKLSSIIPEDGIIVAPNAPFPVPVKKKEHFSPGYAWYFFDPSKKTYYINYDPAAYFMRNFLSRIWPFDLPITIIGYSQGGYIAPKIAEVVPNVDTVIAMASTFRNNRFEYRQDVTLHQIHSPHDLVVDYDEAKQEFDQLTLRGNSGEFITLNEAGHKLDQEYKEALQKLIV